MRELSLRMQSEKSQVFVFKFLEWQIAIAVACDAESSQEGENITEEVGNA